MNILEIDKEKQMLLDQKNQLVIEMHSLDNKLLGIKNELRRKGLMPKIEYDKHLKNQVKYREAIVERERKVADIKRRLIEIADDAHHKELEVVASPTIVQELVKLRQYYQEFSADHTHISSMRLLAADFVLRLSNVIKDDLKRPLPINNGEKLAIDS